MALDRPSFAILEKEKAGNRKKIKIISKALSFIDMEVSRIESAYGTGSSVGEVHLQNLADFGNEATPVEWSDHINLENLHMLPLEKGTQLLQNYC